MNQVQNSSNLDRVPLIKTRGVYPSEANPGQLSKINEVFTKLISSIAVPEINGLKIDYPTPILHHLPAYLVGWPSEEINQAKIFAHIFSGSYLKDSGLEGINYSDIAQYVEAWFHYFATVSNSSEVVEFVQANIPYLKSLQAQEKELVELSSVRQDQKTLASLQKLAAQRMHTIRSQSEGVPYLMSGGWTGKPAGHAMLYEFIRKGKTFELRVFNTGAGREYHLNGVQGTKQKISPILLKEGIPEEELNLFFFQSLLEPLILPNWELKGIQIETQEMPQFIYRMIDQLTGITVPLDLSYNRIITAQRAGTCSCDSLMAFLQYRAGEKGLGLFEQIRLCLRLGTLSQAFKSWSDDLQVLITPREGFISKVLCRVKIRSKQSISDKSSELMALLEVGAQRILSDSVKPVFLKNHTNWFSLEETALAQNTGHFVLSFLSQLRSGIQKKRLDEIRVFSLKSNPNHLNLNLISSLGRSLLNEIPGQGSVIRSLSSRERLCLNGKFPPQCDPSQCALFLESQLKKIEIGARGWTSFQIQAEIRWLIESLPIPKVGSDDFWQKILDSDLLACSQSLDTLLKIYFEHSPADALAVMPEDQNVIFSIVTMLHSLALRSEKLYSEEPFCSLSQYRIAPPTQLLETDPYTVLFSSFALKRRQEILDYFSDYNGARNHFPILFDFSSSFASLPYNDIRFVEAIKNREDFRYYLQWIERLEGASQNLHLSHLFKLSKKLLNENFGLVFFHRRKDISSILSKNEKKALSVMLDPSLLFSEGVYSQIALLHNAALTAHICAGNWKKLEPESKIEEKPGIGCFLSYQYEPNLLYRIYYFFKNRESGIHKVYSVPQITWEDHRSVRLHTNDPTELNSTRKDNEYKLRPKSKTEAHALPRMDLRNVVDPLARPLQVLAAAEHKIPLFKQAQERIHFMIDFFGSNLLNPNSEELVTPLKLLCDQPEFIKRCDEFITNGLNYYWNFPKKSDRDISAALFFIRISQLMNEWIPEEEVESRQLATRQFMRKILQDENHISSEDRIAIYTHLILSYEKKDFSKLSHEEIHEILTIWFKLDRNFRLSKFSNPYSAYRAQYLIWELLPKISDVLSTTPTLSQKIAQTIWSQCGKDSVLHWIYDPQERKFKSSSKEGRIVLDLQNRSTRINNIDMYTSLYIPEIAIQVAGFKRIFGERRPSQCLSSDQSGSQIIYFKDSIWGDVQIHLQDHKSMIIRSDQQGRKYGLISDPDFCSKYIPLSIRHQAVLWVPLFQQDSECNGLLCDPLTGKILYQMKENGDICRALGGRSLQLIPSPDVLNRVDSPGNSLTWQDEKGDILIEYPFILSSHLNPLEFHMISNGLNPSGALWKENPEYRIAEDQQNGLLGSSFQYLVLKHIDTKKRKILVPLIQHHKSKVLSSYSAFTRDFSFDDSSGIFQDKKSFGFVDPKVVILAFDLENDRPVGKTPIENMMLSYLYFSQRDFQTSLRYFEQIEMKNRFSPSEWVDLWKIIEWMGSVKDYSVEANGLLLRAYALVRDELGHPHNFFSNGKTEAEFASFKDKFLTDSYEIYTSYLESTNHGSSLLELPSTNERKWKDFFPPDGRSLVRGRGKDSPITYQMNGPARGILNVYDLYKVPNCKCASHSFSEDLLPNTFILSNPDFYNEFYQYYHWIRTGNKEVIDYLVYLFSQVFIVDMMRPDLHYLGLLYLACFVKDPKNTLPKALNDPHFNIKYNDQQEHFNKIVEAIHTNTNIPRFLRRQKSQVRLPTSTPPPCLH